MLTAIRVLALVMVSALFAREASAQSAWISLMYPNGGEDLVVDSTYDIRWVSQNVTGSLSVEYSIDSGATWRLISTVSARAGADTLAWTVPNELTSRGLVRVRTADSALIGRSLRTFSIVAAPVPRIRVVAPNGGEVFARDSTTRIRWIAENISGQVSLEYSVDSGATWKPITTVAARAGLDSALWTIPADPTSRGLVRVRSTDNSASDVSDRSFSIRLSVNPTVIVLHPNGGETFRIDSMISVRWLSSDLSGQIMVEFSSDGGATWRGVSFPRPARDGLDSVGWQVPTDTTRRGLIRVRMLSGPASDQSDAFFAIAGTPPPPKPTLTLLAPIGGSAYHADSVIFVRWTSSNVGGDLVVEYSLDNSGTYTPIATVAARDGMDSVAWTIPNVSSSSVIVRVRTVDGSVQSRSLTTFRILPRGSASVIGEARSIAVAGVGTYPNPAGASAALRWTQLHRSDVSIRVVTVEGRVAISQTIGVLPSGEHEATIDVASLSSGSYRCEVRAGADVATTTLVVVR